MALEEVDTPVQELRVPPVVVVQDRPRRVPSRARISLVWFWARQTGSPTGL